MIQKLKSGAMLLVVLAAAGGGFYYYKQKLSQAQPDTETQPNPNVASQPAGAKAPPPVQPAIKYPVNPQSESTAPMQQASGDRQRKPLPPVDESDDAVIEELYGVFGKGRFESLLNLQGLARRFVITVNDLTRPRPVPPDYTAFAAVEGEFRIQKENDSQVMSPNNAARYRPYISLVQDVDLNKLVSFYRYFYPLFQSAFHDISPRGYFNDRLIEVIDHLIQTPEVAGPVALKREKVYYQFVDPKLEALSTGQKAMIRMGVENSRIVKAKLSQLRGILAAGQP
jgi:hypothetical protein